MNWAGFQPSKGIQPTQVHPKSIFTIGYMNCCGRLMEQVLIQFGESHKDPRGKLPFRQVQNKQLVHLLIKVLEPL